MVSVIDEGANVAVDKQNDPSRPTAGLRRGLARRDVLVAGTGAAALATWLAVIQGVGKTAIAQSISRETESQAAVSAGSSTNGLGGSAGNGSAANGWKAEYSRIVGTGIPVEGRLTLDLPAIAENGNMVPFTVAIDSPMTDRDYVRAIHVLVTANPSPTIATFRLSPQSGEAIVASRLRLSQSQAVIAIAELSDGQFLISRRDVEVAIGGCGV